jgi:hypothetical protein
MELVVEERSAWLRTSTHTVVLDRDPDFGRFATNPTGRAARWIRTWVSEPGRDGPVLTAYLGGLGVCAAGVRRTDLLRILRRLSRLAPGEDRRRLRRRLRQYL